MKRRDFFKIVTGFVVGIFTTSMKSKEDFPIPTDPLKDKFVLNHILTKGVKKRSGTRYCGESSTGIDPNSEWAKQKPLTLDMLIKAKKEMEVEWTRGLIDPTREYFKMVNKELPPLLQKNIDDTIIKVFA